MRREMVSGSGPQVELFDEAGKKKTNGGAKGKLGKLGYELGEVASALQKEIRRGDVEAAVYWALLLYDAAPFYVWKRILVIACEDVGLADPQAVRDTYQLALGWRFAKENAWFVSPHAVTMAVVRLAEAPKSTEIEDLQSWTLERIKRGEKLPILREYQDGHTKAGKERGATWKEWYHDRHVTFGIPVNEYTRRLWELQPDWKPDLPEVDRSRDVLDDNREPVRRAE
jgi:putative ATPase